MEDSEAPRDGGTFKWKMPGSLSDGMEPSCPQSPASDILHYDVDLSLYWGAHGDGAACYSS